MKTSKTIITIVMIILMAGIIFMTACRKNAASITGTWTETSQREQEKVSGATILDTTTLAPTPAPIATFNGDGTYQSASGTLGAGTYTLAGSTLIVSDTGRAGTQILSVLTLTDNALSLQKAITDTIPPYQSFYYTINFKR